MANSRSISICNFVISAIASILISSCGNEPCDGCGGCAYIDFIDTVKVDSIEHVSIDEDFEEPIHAVYLKTIDGSRDYIIEGQFLDHIRKDFEIFQFENRNPKYVLSGGKITSGSCPPFTYDSIYIMPNINPFETLIDSIWRSDHPNFSGFLELKQNPETGDLGGWHQFINHDGSRIDACDSNSIHLTAIKEGVWKGIIKDCYFADVHQIELRFVENRQLQFTISENEHIFLPDTFLLHNPEETVEN